MNEIELIDDYSNYSDTDNSVSDIPEDSVSDELFDLSTEEQASTESEVSNFDDELSDLSDSETHQEIKEVTNQEESSTASSGNESSELVSDSSDSSGGSGSDITQVVVDFSTLESLVGVTNENLSMVSVKMDTIHYDLGLICSLLVWFFIFKIFKYLYRFFRIFI